ncbi:MAG TPA: aconitate hydratase [Vicinamibacterales bacterium]|jgi:aconitate hydratase
MGNSVTRQIIEQHLLEGQMVAGNEVAIRIDQTLTQDATGTMAYLQFEAIGIPRVRTELSVSYVDHNTLQSDFKNADDHNYLRTVAARHGIVFSRPGNGICHQVHLERFAAPGKTLIGSDSHTPTAGGIGSLALGAGGLDVACAMAGEPFRIKFPRIAGIKLTGKLSPWVSAKDVILELLRRVDVKGGVGKVFEYFGPGVRSLSVPDRATITNMGTETGATTSIFPSDAVTKAFLKAQGREAQWVKLEADGRRGFDEIVEIDLGQIEPLAATPHSPGAVKSIREIGRIPVQQVCIGSCTNSSLEDMKVTAAVLKGKTIAENLHLTVNPGSRQVVEHLVETGDMRDLVAAGARILENACGPCIGMGAAPPSGAVSVRTFNRNFEGRSGTKDAAVYLVSPEVAAATAVAGVLTDPRDLGEQPKVRLPKSFFVNDNLFIKPLDEALATGAQIVRGPNIAPLPAFPPLPEMLCGEVLLKVGDNITTDHIMPAGAKVLPLRSNIPEIAKYVFEAVDATFAQRAKAAGGGFIVGGDNYGQGSSREHAALAPKYLGVKAVIVRSFARIHLANLINFGIVPLTFKNPADYDAIEPGDHLEVVIGDLQGRVVLRNVTDGTEAELVHALSPLDAKILKAGGKLPWIKAQLEERA